MKSTPLFLILLVWYNVHVMAQQVRVIPEPVTVFEKPGFFHFDSSCVVSFPEDSGVIKTLHLFARELQEFSGIDILKKKTQQQSTPNIIIRFSNKKQIKKEGYILEVSPGHVQITAIDGAGVFYAFQTIRQLFSSSLYTTRKTSSVSIPCVLITDYPRYAYRGMHLDVSRHFFSTAFIKQYLDILAMYKINTFHWHLTDSHGWRLEIKQYPKLTSVGGWRADRSGIPMTIAPVTQATEPATYGGFYTQEEVKEIIQYATDRSITIIPEIEVPGHCTAALVAYPEFNDLDNPVPLLMPCGYPGDLKHNFCVSYDSTYIFIGNILKEVMALFPSSYIHIGGDEVRGDPWLGCSRCRKLMKEKEFTTAKQLQSYFTKRIDSFVEANGKHIIGWDEILADEVSPKSIGMAWHGPETGIADIRKGYDVVMTPFHYTYFDFYQSDPQLEPDISYTGLPLDTVYAFNPTPSSLSSQETSHILGIEACLWTENIATEKRAEYMLLPRLLALAEVAWTPLKRKNYQRFISKTEIQFKRFDALGINYATSLYNVAIRPKFDPIKKTVSIKLNKQVPNYPVYYTTNGSDPSTTSKKYTQPIVVNHTAVFKAAVFNKTERLGKISTDSVAIHTAVGAKVKMEPMPGNKPPLALSNLTDGIFGSVEPYDFRWIFFTDSSLNLIIDLSKEQPVHLISLQSMEDQVGNIFCPAQIEFATSLDGKVYTKQHTVTNKKVPEQLLRHIAKFTTPPFNASARFIKINIRNANIFKEREKNMLFFDEIVVQ
ncbi:MAG: family 20 glycosylhydrolase [Chitinophagaceae bacterium]